MGVYRRSIPFTASNTAASTIAVTRVENTGLVLPLSTVCTMIWFQSVTSSALHRLGTATAMAKTIKAASITADQNKLVLHLSRTSILIPSLISVFAVSIRAVV